MTKREKKKRKSQPSTQHINWFKYKPQPSRFGREAISHITHDAGSIVARREADRISGYQERQHDREFGHGEFSADASVTT